MARFQHTGTRTGGRSGRVSCRIPGLEGGRPKAQQTRREGVSALDDGPMSVSRVLQEFEPKRKKDVSRK